MVLGKLALYLSGDPGWIRRDDGQRARRGGSACVRMRMIFSVRIRLSLSLGASWA